MKKWAFAAVSLAFVGIACGGSSGGTDGGPTMDAGGGKDSSKKDTSPPDTGNDTGGPDACTTYATAYCLGISQCSKIIIPSVYGTQADCEKAVGQDCANEIAASGTGASAATKLACATAIGSWSCEGFLNEQSIPHDCKTPKGSVARRGACAFSSQCDTGYCEIKGYEACGKCKGSPNVGDPCDRIASCGQGLVCGKIPNTGGGDAGAPDGGSTSGGRDLQVCLVPGASGAACGPSAQENQCEIGLNCVGASAKMGTQGMCEPGAGTLGMRCSPGEHKKAGCDENQGLVCDKATRKCIDLTVANPGDACNNSDTLCVNGSECSAGPGPMATGNCTAAVADKGKCDKGHGAAPCSALERCVVAKGASSGTCEFDGTTTCK